MDEKRRQALRVAQWLRDTLVQRGLCDLPAELPEQSWTRVLQLSRRIESAQDRGWHHAARRLRDLAHQTARLVVVGRLEALVDRHRIVHGPAAGQVGVAGLHRLHDALASRQRASQSDAS